MSWRVFSPLVRRFATQSARPLDFAQMPGPKYYPFLGSFNDVMTLGKNEKLHLTVDEMHRKYGAIFRVKIDSMDTVFLASADYMRAMFAYEGKYPKHPIPPAWLYFNRKFDIQRGMIFMNDTEWLSIRHVMNAFLLKDSGWSQALIEMTCDNFASKLRRLLDSEHATVIENLEDELYLWSVYSILNLMLGSSTSEQTDREFDAKVWEFVTVVKRIFVTSARLMSIPPNFADRVNMRVYRDFETAAHRSIALSRGLISILSNDMQSSEHGLLRKMKSQHLSDDVIVRVFSDLIIAAGDTTVYTTQWLLHAIARDAALSTKLKKEISANAGSMETPLVRACLRETLRLYPVAPFIGRFLETDAEIGGFAIPRSVLAIASLYTSGRDAANFSDPLRFEPERWLRDNKQHDGGHTVTPHASMPFAMGSRSCVGKKIATHQIHSLVTKILQQFSLESRNEQEVKLKLQLIGVPDRKIQIAFRKTPQQP